MKLAVERRIFSANDRVAREVSDVLAAAGTYAINLMASPGAGKTSLVLATAERLPPEVAPGVIEGDLASRIDADAIAAQNIPVTQVNTGGGCHLDAQMILAALADLPLDAIDLLFVENVGNLVCPANFDLGTDLNVVVASTPEGDDKPYKYPGIFASADVVVLNKADLLDVFEFDVDYFRAGLQMVNSQAPLFVVSCKTGAGLHTWLTWLRDQA